MPMPKMMVLSHFFLSLIIFPSFICSYTILGDQQSPEDDRSLVTQTLRHFQPPREVKLRVQSQESSGRVSMAGSLWEASLVLADYITNPDCPVEAFRRMRVGSHVTGDNVSNDHYTLRPKRGNDERRSFFTGTSIGPQNVGQMLFNEDLLKSGRGDLGVGSKNQWRDFRGMEYVAKTTQQQQSAPSTAATVVELGSGVGLPSLAAALLGCRVYATDGSPSSIRLLHENFHRHAHEYPNDFQPQASLLDWGDVDAVNSFICNELEGRLPDVVMASDVVYVHSAREELARTIRQLCPRGHTSGRILLAHMWRANPAEEEAFFRSFDEEFVRNEAGVEFMPDDTYYRVRNARNMKLPVTIFELRRKF